MKKKIVTILFLLLSGVSGFCSCDFICPAPYDLTSGASRTFSNITGQNFIAEQVAQNLIKKAVKKNLNKGDIKADLKSFSVRDLKAGRFKSIEIFGKNVISQGIYITSFNAKTLCDFNYIQEKKDGDIFIKENIPMSLDIVITEDDLNNTMNSSNYKRFMDDINNTLPDFFRVEASSVKLKNDKLYYVLKYSVPFMQKSKEVVLYSSVKVENGRIALKDTKLLEGYGGLNKLASLLNYVNPLDFSAKILENKKAKFNIQNIKISDKKININGIITLLKDKE